MKKSLKIIGFILLACFIVAAIVLYIVFPAQAKETINDIWDFLNKPLPIVGVTTIAILFFVWQLVIKTRFGKGALTKLENEYKSKYEKLLDEKKTLEEEREENKEEIKEMKNCIINLCSLIPNKKVNELGDKFAKGLEYGEETNDSETKAN